MRRFPHYKQLAAAEEKFLRARGWVQTGPDAWIEPRAKEGNEPRTLCFGHAVNSEMLYSSTEDMSPDEPPRRKEPDLEDIELRAAQEAYLLALGWETVSEDEFEEDVFNPDLNGTMYQRRGKQALPFKRALDQAKYHDRKHGAHLPEET